MTAQTSRSASGQAAFSDVKLGVKFIRHGEAFGSESVSILDSLGLPEAPRQVYSDAPLAVALCQVRFPRDLSVTDPRATATFQRAIQARYPNLEEAQDAVVSLNFGPVSATTQRSAPKWQFSDPDGDWIVVLAQDYLALEARRYDRFEMFLDRLQEALRAWIKHFRPVGITRIGLRYINEVRLNGARPRDVLRPEALGILGDTPFEPFIRQSIHEEVMNLDEGQAIQIRHGLVPGGTIVTPRPGQTIPGEDSPFYLLDFDVSQTFVKTTLPDSRGNSVLTRVSEYHEVIHRLFHWFVTPEFLGQLRTVDNDV